MSWRKYLLLPELVWAGIRRHHDQVTAWDRYWGAIRRTGPDGEVLWDGAGKAELQGSLERILAHMDRALPVVDVGCGNGRQARLLAPHFPRVIGVDVSPQAIARAQRESAGFSTVTFRVLDASAPGAGQRLHEQLGDVNVFIRGVLHILEPAHCAMMVGNVRAMVGRHGVLYFLETNVEGSPLDYLETLGARVGAIPLPLRRCLESGLAAPRHFGERQLDELVRHHAWQALTSGVTDIYAVPLGIGGEVARIPGFFAVLRPGGEGQG